MPVYNEMTMYTEDEKDKINRDLYELLEARYFEAWESFVRLDPFSDKAVLGTFNVSGTTLATSDGLKLKKKKNMPKGDIED